MNKNAKRRKNIFNTYSGNLSNVAKKFKIKLIIGGKVINPAKTPVYICPLCCRGFSKEILDHESFDNHLTLEDVPPKSVEGKPILLTCKECNNKSGFKVDHAIQTYLKVESFLKRISGSELKTRIELVDGRIYKAEAKIEDHKGITFVSNPNRKIKEDFSFLEKNWEGAKIKFSFQAPAQKTLRLAYLRTGLLLSFYYFGNALLMDENYHKLKKYVMDGNLKKIPHNGLIDLTGKINTKVGLHIIKKPNDYIAYLTTFKVSKGSITKTIGVFIPGPYNSGWKKYENLKNVSHNVDISLTDITTDNYLTKPEFADAYFKLYDFTEKGLL